MNHSQIDCYTTFGSIQQLWASDAYEKNGLEEFVQNVILNKDIFDVNNQNGFGIMLHDLSNLYVLVSKSDFPYHKLQPNHKMNISFKKNQPNTNTILGYIWISDTITIRKHRKPLYFIKFIDSRISGLNIANYMIQKFEAIGMGRMLLPYEIQFSAKGYWEKYFIEKYKVNNKILLEHFITKYHIHEQCINWSHIFNI